MIKTKSNKVKRGLVMVARVELINQINEVTLTTT